MKEVILHIGLHKTGSTSIQSALQGYSNGDKKAVGFKEENHSIPMYTIFSENRYRYHIWKRLGYTKTRIDSLQKKYLEILRMDLSDTSYRTLIISGEDISTFSRSEIRNMLGLFGEYNVSVKVVGYVRNPLDRVVSATQERIKTGQKVVKEGSGFRLELEKILDCFGKENVTVFCFDEVIKSHGSVVKHFSKVFSLNLTEPPRVNEGLSPLQLALVVCLNEVPLKIWGNEYRLSLRKKILHQIKEIKEQNTKYTQLEKRYFYNLLGDNIGVDLAWLNKEFGIKYELNQGEKSLSLDDYFEEVLSNSSNGIERLFSELGVVYDSKDSISNNFLEAYFELASEKNDFSAQSYLSVNPDVAASGINPYQHYLMFGIKEYRRIK